MIVRWARVAELEDDVESVTELWEEYGAEYGDRMMEALSELAEARGEIGPIVEDVTHYSGDTPCDCGDTHHDPETGICLSCDPVLYRVVAYPDEWFSDSDMEAPSVLVGGRGLADTVARLARETGRSVDVSLA